MQGFLLRWLWECRSCRAAQELQGSSRCWHLCTSAATDCCWQRGWDGAGSQRGEGRWVLDTAALTVGGWALGLHIFGKENPGAGTWVRVAVLSSHTAQPRAAQG